MRFKKPIFLFIVLLVGIGGIYSCKTFYFRSNYKSANELIHITKNLKEKPFLKAHMKDGAVFIFGKGWSIDTAANRVMGTGDKYDFNRFKLTSGALSANLDSVALFETNKEPVGNGAARIAAIGILTAVNVGIGIFCILNPKACFGSCPTFYLNPDQNFHLADAEGFSNAISPALEYGDVDALPAIESDSLVSITMKNEAQETHCIREISLWCVKKRPGEFVFHNGKEDFFRCRNTFPISNSSSLNGAQKSLYQPSDGNEWFSLADSKNLATKEEMVLEFDHVPTTTSLGLIVHFRQTLMTTYFIYSALGYMGDEIGDYMAKLETQPDLGKKLKSGIWSKLGSIEVFQWNENTQNWDLTGSLYETGPIAINKQLVVLKHKGQKKKNRLKLVMNKGLWRLDYIALTNVLEKAAPEKIKPMRVFNRGKLDIQLLNKVNDPEELLISMPGNELEFQFDLPEKGQSCDYFLYSKGYYLEWMRETWLADKNLSLLRKMISEPEAYLKEVAPDYKEYEKTMEKQFWDSRIDTKTFTRHAL